MCSIKPPTKNHNRDVHIHISDLNLEEIGHNESKQNLFKLIHRDKINI